MEELTGVSVPSRKEREKKARQQEILHAARIIFSEKGFHDTTLEEIAHKAEFAKGTIYNYFANKDELFYGMIDDVFDEMQAFAVAVLGVEGMPVHEQLNAYARSTIEHAVKNSALFKLMMREAPRYAMEEFDAKMKHLHDRELETRKLLASVIAGEIGNARLSQNTQLEVAMLFDGMLRFYCMNHIKATTPLTGADIDRAAKLIVTVFFEGIQTK